MTQDLALLRARCLRLGHHHDAEAELACLLESLAKARGQGGSAARDALRNELRRIETDA
jgi:hypothetical protein